jgi:hypothetical protein
MTARISGRGCGRDYAAHGAVMEIDATTSFSPDEERARVKLVESLDEAEFHASISGATFFVLVARERNGLAISSGDQICSFAAGGDQVVDHGLCASLRKVAFVCVGPQVIGMAGDLHFFGSVGNQYPGKAVEFRKGFGFKVPFVVFEENIVDPHGHVLLLHLFDCGQDDVLHNVDTTTAVRETDTIGCLIIAIAVCVVAIVFPEGEHDEVFTVRRIALRLPDTLMAAEILPLYCSFEGVAVSIGDHAPDSCDRVGASFLGEPYGIDIVTSVSAAQAVGAEPGHVSRGRYLVAPVLVGGVDFLAEINRFAPFSPRILLKSDGFEDVHFTQSLMAIGTEIQGFAVGVKEGCVFAIGCVDVRAEVDRIAPGVAPRQADIDVLIPEMIPVKGIVIG